MPGGELETAPLPVPAVLTVNVPSAGSNVAVTARSPAITTVQSPSPSHAPAHDENSQSSDGAGMRETAVPSGNTALQRGGQLMPAGELDTEPSPVTATPSTCVTVSTSSALRVRG